MSKSIYLIALPITMSLASILGYIGPRLSRALYEYDIDGISEWIDNTSSLISDGTSGLFEMVIPVQFITGAIFCFWGITRPAKSKTYDHSTIKNDIFSELNSSFLNFHMFVIYMHCIFFFWGCFIFFGSGSA